ncbi:hypothetical protein AHAS_Ahas12G0165800 [Arachis hypogaea]
MRGFHKHYSPHHSFDHNSSYGAPIRVPSAATRSLAKPVVLKVGLLVVCAPNTIEKGKETLYLVKFGSTQVPQRKESFTLKLVWLWDRVRQMPSTDDPETLRHLDVLVTVLGSMDIAGCTPLLMSWIYQRFSQWCPPERGIYMYPMTARLVGLQQQSRDQHEARVLRAEYRSTGYDSMSLKRRQSTSDMRTTDTSHQTGRIHLYLYLLHILLLLQPEKRCG